MVIKIKTSKYYCFSTFTNIVTVPTEKGSKIFFLCARPYSYFHTFTRMNAVSILLIIRSFVNQKSTYVLFFVVVVYGLYFILIIDFDVVSFFKKVSETMYIQIYQLENLKITLQKKIGIIVEI